MQVGEVTNRLLKVIKIFIWSTMIGAIVVFCSSAAFFWFILNDERPPLTVEVKDQIIIVLTMHLGEYASAVSRICISEQESREIVWEVISTEERGWSAMGGVHFLPGENESPKFLPETFRTVIPEAGRKFLLHPGRKYRIEVWGEDRDSSCSRTFVVPYFH